MGLQDLLRKYLKRRESLRITTNSTIAEQQAVSEFIASAKALEPPKTHYKDITGSRFGKLAARNIVRMDSSGRAYWYCICDCGNSASVRGDKLRGNLKTSCGKCK